MSPETAKQAKRRRQREARERNGRSNGASLDGDRVFLPEPAKPLAIPARDAAEHIKEEFVDRFVRERAREIYPVVRLTDHGVDWGVPPGVGDEVGYGMHPYRSDDCLRACIATVTQIPIEEVPDLRLDARLRGGHSAKDISRSSWSQLEQWLSGRNLAIQIWTELPIWRHRWIGVFDSGNHDNDEVEFGDHCLVMCREYPIFNPNCSVVPPPGTEVLDAVEQSIIYGITLDKEE